MLVRFIHGDSHRDLVITVHDPDATVSDLAAVLSKTSSMSRDAGDPRRTGGALIVDGRPVPASMPLDRSGISDGATIESIPAVEPAPNPRRSGVPGGVVAEVLSGPSSGTRVHLPPGIHRVGRAPMPGTGRLPVSAGGLTLALEDPGVSTVHAEIEIGSDGRVQVRDLGSTNGTRTGDEVEMGTSRVQFDPSGNAREIPAGPRPAGRALHRVPRRLPETVEVPEPPAPVGADPGVSPIGFVALASSLVVGVTMIVVLGSMTYALFALLGPLLILGHAADSRLRRRRSRRRGTRNRARELKAFGGELGTLAVLEVQRRDRWFPSMTSIRRSAVTGASLWERRPDHPDAFAVRVGTGLAPWSTLTETLGDRGDDPALEQTVGPHRLLSEAAVGLVLDAGSVVALTGPAPLMAALARSMVVQAATTHGPADLALALITAPGAVHRWDWCAWLPHAADGEGSLLASDPDAAAGVVHRLVNNPPAPGRTLVVVDDPPGLTAARSPSRTVLRAVQNSDLAAIVLVPPGQDVPAMCDPVIVAHEDGTVSGPAHLFAGRTPMAGTTAAVAAEVARSLARWDDPEHDDDARRLPRRCDLSDLVGDQGLDSTTVAARWSAARPTDHPTVPIGFGSEGPFEIDLVRDGPHMLVAGTTGSGKSELLRTLVVGLAARQPPDRLSFVLVDFKGGSTFDRCADLPHVVGVATDLDAHQAGRVLVSLDAEIRHREQVVRDAGVTDFDELLQEARVDAMARLVVVIDEFATLAQELPDLIPGLVGLAQRGRSLGMHLVLATQRPGSSVNEDLRANMALRVALRVQSPTESSDIVEVRTAADIPRSRPGRAIVRLGPGELHQVQTATTGSTRPPGRAPVTVTPLTIRRATPGSSPEGEPNGDATADDPTTDLHRRVRAMVEAWDRFPGREVRRPWVEPLPPQLDWPIPATSGPRAGVGSAEIVLGWADEPDRQRQVPFGWDPAQGPFLAVGLAGSGTTTLAATAVLGAARRWAPDECHIHIIDHGSGRLGPLAGLPHVGAVITATEEERIRRLLDELARDLSRRRSTGSREPRRILVVDGAGALRTATDPLDPEGPWARLETLVTGGSDAGIHLLLTADGVGAIPHSMVSRCSQRLIMRLGDPADHGSFSIPARAVPELVAGRGIEPHRCRLVQVARPADGTAAAVARVAATAEAPPGDRAPQPVSTLPTLISWSDLDRAAPGGSGPTGESAGDGLGLLVGLDADSLAPTHLELAPGAHALVAGPARSGRSATLDTLAASARAQGRTVIRVAGGPGAGASPDHGPGADALAALLDGTASALVLVDDADLTPDDHSVLSLLVTRRRPGIHVVAAGRGDRLRRSYGHWTRELRSDRLGLLLLPDPDLDGDLLGTQLPRRSRLARVPGRAWMVSGDREGFVQVARVDPESNTIS